MEGTSTCVVGNCRHNISKVLPHNMILAKSYDIDGSKCIETMVVCDNCLVWYRRNNLICNNEKELNEWVGSE